jgi:hypothetical protein
MTFGQAACTCITSGYGAALECFSPTTTGQTALLQTPTLLCKTVPSMRMLEICVTLLASLPTSSLVSSVIVKLYKTIKLSLVRDWP